MMCGCPKVDLQSLITDAFRQTRCDADRAVSERAPEPALFGGAAVCRALGLPPAALEPGPARRWFQVPAPDEGPLLTAFGTLHLLVGADVRKDRLAGLRDVYDGLAAAFAEWAWERRPARRVAAPGALRRG